MNNNEPITLGKLKKGGKSKPILIILIFLIIGSIILFIPTISNYFGDYNIIDLIKNGEIIDFFKNHDSYINNTNIIKSETKDTNEKNYINTKTKITMNNIELSNFKLTKDNISFNITSNNTDLNEKNYYLILKQNDNELSIIKITNENIINYTFKNKLDSLINIEGIIKEYKDNDFPNHILSSDESGLASLVCKKDNDELEYIFDNNKLIQIKESYTYYDTGERNVYLEEFNKYSNKVKEIINNNGNSSLEENINGFIFKTDIDLKNYTAKTNENYYSYETNVNKINFDMNAKGFDCK
mgnify:FL=1